jgi:hypothetical protein
MYRKYRNKPVRAEGKYFASKKEYAKWCELRMLEKAGKIFNLQFQVPYIIIPADEVFKRPVKYVADFVWREPDHEKPWDLQMKTVVADAKGVRTQTYILKRRLMWQYWKILVKEI